MEDTLRVFRFDDYSNPPRSGNNDNPRINDKEIQSFRGRTNPVPIVQRRRSINNKILPVSTRFVGWKLLAIRLLSLLRCEQEFSRTREREISRWILDLVKLHEENCKARSAATFHPRATPERCSVFILSSAIYDGFAVMRCHLNASCLSAHTSQWPSIKHGSDARSLPTKHPLPSCPISSSFPSLYSRPSLSSIRSKAKLNVPLYRRSRHMNFPPISRTSRLAF